MKNNENLQYYKDLRKKLEEENFNKTALIARKIIHPIILKLMSTTIKFDIKIINDLPQVDGPAIYIVNHSNTHDAPVASKIIEKHHYVLVGKQDLKFIDKVMFKLNGCLYVDRKNKQSKNETKEEIIKVLLSGGNILMFPEGTWNLSENQIMLPMNWGMVDIAKIANVPIVPIIMEYNNDKCYINCGELMFFDNESKQEAIDTITDTMATLRWNIWEQLPMEMRKNVSRDDYKKYIDFLIKEYPKLNYEYEKSVIRKNGASYDEVFEPIHKIAKQKKYSAVK